MEKVMTEIHSRIEHSTVKWLTGGELNSGMSIRSKKFGDDFAYFLVIYKNEAIILYAWYSEITKIVSISQEEKVLVSNKGEERVAEHLFKTLVRRI